MTTFTRVDNDVIRKVVGAACMAPSVHNTQPWRWVVDDQTLYLLADPARHLSHADEFGRQMLLSCGAALDHLVIALSECAIRARVTEFPVSDDENVLAAIEFIEADDPALRHPELAAAIAQRHSDRRPFAMPSTSVVRRVAAAVESISGVQAVVLPSYARDELLEASDITASARRYDAVYKNELHWWTGHDTPRDGVPPSALPKFGPFEHALSRDFSTGELEMGTAADEAAWMVLSTLGDERADWLRAGAAMSRGLLAATAAGAATCPISHVTELPQSRKMVADMAEKAGGRADQYPQILLRIGARAARPTAPTARRDVDEVLRVIDRRP
ncbi:FMN-binding protein Acg [Gordonia jinhuaensis]|uniref:NAD(P)H nitroreductase acg n=1 Tax=Gordonia jinhuaensis TaxID=1517702 RepID=A0A916SW55_9ACTN|nr:nitroreductase family protein [Gordonia jinhuaensis]GGB16767.1 putative NAD(P)H nitroreductase acg [Gordonia jinhuaensis]